MEETGNGTLVTRGTCILVDCPLEVDIVASKWVFNIKYHINLMGRSKAKGYIQTHEFDFFDIFHLLIDWKLFD